MFPLDEKYPVALKEWQELENSPIPVIYIGTATCGRAAGAKDVLEAIKEFSDKNGLFARVIEVGCLGLCYLEPILIIQKPKSIKICYGKIKLTEINVLLEKAVWGDDICEEWIIGKVGNGSFNHIPELFSHPMLKNQTRNILRNCGFIDPENINHYLAHNGYKGFLKSLLKRPEQILEEVKNSGLRGRGGAGFPTWKKWKICMETNSDQKFIICNADEGDPGAFMNRSLLEGDPHSVIEGMLIAGYTLGANKGYIYCRAEYPLALRRLEVAVSQMKEYGLCGSNIQGSGFSFESEIKQGAGAFVCGEETALIASIEGKRGMPTPRPPYPAEKGLWGKPTVIQNVETLANLPLIMLEGAEWWSKWGSDNSRGTKTFSLAGKVARTGLIEVPLGISLREMVMNIGGGVGENGEAKAVQIGGPSGGCIPYSLFDLPVDFDALTDAGAIMGSGGVIVLDEHTCIVDVARYFLSFTQKESCGKCPPCRVGTKAMLHLLEKICQGNGVKEDLKNLEDLAYTVKEGSLCGLGKTAPNPVITSIKYFYEEFEEHILYKKCRALVCKTLIRFKINDKRCVGCGICAKGCPVKAISGVKGKPYQIEQSICIRCGICLNVCPTKYAAVFKDSGEME